MADELRDAIPSIAQYIATELCIQSIGKVLLAPFLRAEYLLRCRDDHTTILSYWQQIVEGEGVKGLFRLAPVMCVNNVLQIGVSLLVNSFVPGTPLVPLAVFLTLYPLEMITLHLATDYADDGMKKYSGITNCFRSLVTTYGYKSLYCGFVSFYASQYIRSIVTNIAFGFAYNFITPDTAPIVEWVVYLSVAQVPGVLCYALDTARFRVMMKPTESLAKKFAVTRELTKCVKERTVGRLVRGYTCRIVGATLSTIAADVLRGLVF